MLAVASDMVFRLARSHVLGAEHKFAERSKETRSRDHIRVVRQTNYAHRMSFNV